MALQLQLQLQLQKQLLTRLLCSFALGVRAAYLVFLGVAGSILPPSPTLHIQGYDATAIIFENLPSPSDHAQESHLYRAARRNAKLADPKQACANFAFRLAALRQVGPLDFSCWARSS